MAEVSNTTKAIISGIAVKNTKEHSLILSKISKKKRKCHCIIDRHNQLHQGNNGLLLNQSCVNGEVPDFTVNQETVRITSSLLCCFLLLHGHRG